MEIWLNVHLTACLSPLYIVAKSLETVVKKYFRNYFNQHPYLYYFDHHVLAKPFSNLLQVVFHIWQYSKLNKISFSQISFFLVNFSQSYNLNNSCLQKTLLHLKFVFKTTKIRILICIIHGVTTLYLRLERLTQI